MATEQPITTETVSLTEKKMDLCFNVFFLTHTDVSKLRRCFLSFFTYSFLFFLLSIDSIIKMSQTHRAIPM